jgi:hypothetical protein
MRDHKLAYDEQITNLAFFNFKKYSLLKNTRALKIQNIDYQD